MATKVADPKDRQKNHMKAMGHPLRRRVWEYLVETGVASPKQIADALNFDLDDVSYHTRRLAQLHCAELVGMKPVRGATQHFYRAVRQPLVEDGDWNELLESNPALAEQELGVWMQAQLDAYRSAIESGVLGSDDRFLIVRTPVTVDAEGCDRLLAEIDRFEREVVPEIVRESAERRTDSGVDAIKMSVGFNVHKVP